MERLVGCQLTIQLARSAPSGDFNFFLTPPRVDGIWGSGKANLADLFAEDFADC